MTTTFDRDSTRQQLGPVQAYRVQRDGDLDLLVNGWLLGEGEHGTGGSSGFRRDWTRGVKVRIWLTLYGELVAGAHRWSRWQGEHDRYSAARHESAEDALDWLREDASDGELGPASKEAWEAACDAWNGLAGQDVEVVP